MFPNILILDNLNSMKILFTLSVLFFSSSLFAKDQIRSFTIDGMTLGDTALKYFSETEIKKHTDNIYEDNYYTQFTLKSKNLKSDYDSHQIHYKSADQNYIIEVVSGIEWSNSFINCVRKKEKLKKELTAKFSLKSNDWVDQEYETIEAKVNASFFYFENNDSIDLQCTDWDNSVKFRDGFRVSLWSAEFGEWVAK